MRFRLAPPLLLLGLIGLGGCQTAKERAARASAFVELETPEPWLQVAEPEDAGRIERLASAWTEALDHARKAGFARQVRAEGALLDPAAHLPRAAPPPGSYNCRLIKLGASAPRSPAMVAHKPFFCFVGVTGDQLSVTKQTGSLRPGGYLWETAESHRLIFLGSVALGSEEGPAAYGEDRERNMAGVFERYGNLRYRLVIPYPRRTSTLDVFELIPVSGQPAS